MNRLLCVFAALVLFASVAACSNVDTDFPPSSPSTEFSDVVFSPDFPAELQQYCAPWTSNALDDSVQNGTLDYYFMSGKGMLMDSNESDPYKWGDSTLVVFPNGQSMLIDVGMEAYAPVLAENLKRMGIDRVDYLMVSHPHGDHIGGIIAQESFFDMISVGAVLYNGVNRGEKSDLLYVACSERNIPVQIVKKGDVFEFGAARMEILWPLDGTAGKVITKTASLNNHSIVARIDYHAHSSLFVGDLYTSGESAVVSDAWSKLDVDLLKVPHHGYATSSSGMFIYRVSPEIAVAMSGYRRLIQRAYESKGATFLYDKYEGYIHIVTDGTEMSYHTERND